jgi:hypothetical protein
MSEDEATIGRLIDQYYRAFQGQDVDAVTQCLVFPYTFWTSGELIALADVQEFASWWPEYLQEIKSGTGFVRGEILALKITKLSDTAALVRMRSSRLDLHDTLISEVNTAFLTYKTTRGWKIAGLIGNIHD